MVAEFTEHTKGELVFIDVYTRKLLVEWAVDCLKPGREGTFPPPAYSEVVGVYLEHARSKGWVSKRELKVTAKGFQTAASFLKG